MWIIPEVNSIICTVDERKLDSHLTRRNFKSILLASSAIVLSCQASLDTAPSSRPTPHRVSPSTPTPTIRAAEIRDRLHTEALTKMFGLSDQLVQQFPNEFAEAANLEEELTKLDGAGQIQFDAMRSPFVLAWVGAAAPRVVGGRILEVKSVLFLTPSFFNLKQTEDQIIIFLNQLAKHEAQTAILQRHLVNRPAVEVQNPALGLIINSQMLPQEYQNYFRSCQQVQALKTRPQGFNSQVLEVADPRTGIKLYDLYLDILENDEVKDPSNLRWQQAIRSLSLHGPL